MLEVFRSWLGRFCGGARAEIYKHLEAHRNESATIDDLPRTSLRFDTGLVRNVAAELYHVLIMLTRGRAQRLVLKASEPQGLEAYRILFPRFAPISTVTTVSQPFWLKSLAKMKSHLDRAVLSCVFWDGMFMVRKCRRGSRRLWTFGRSSHGGSAWDAYRGSLCLRCESTNVSWSRQWAFPVIPVKEEIVQVLVERIEERIAEQTVDITVPPFMEEIVAAVQVVVMKKCQKCSKSKKEKNQKINK